ncbi:MAG: glycosyltransferase family 39 protein [Anaerolineales bacterium]|nr:glycosyltransferase family 39 protein [Anaerolineales bacterium]
MKPLNDKLKLIAKRIDYANLAFVALATTYLLYGLLYIIRTSIVLDGQRTFALFDDGMISMRYARNLAGGHGLVWNPGGERVEGFSNPLWVFFMALIHLLPLPTHLMSLPVQLSGLLFLFLNLWIIYKITGLVSRSPLVQLLSVFLTAFCYSLNTWGLQGMEVSALTLLVSLAVWRTLLALQAGHFSAWPYLILGLGTLLRIDAAVPYMTILGFSLLFQPKYWKQHLAWGLVLLTGFMFGQILLRYWYFDYPLPNTYYLKLGGVPLIVRLRQGFNIFATFVWSSGWYLMFLPVPLLLLRATRGTLLLGGMFLAQVAYSIYVGGDSWDHQGGANRFLAISIPFFFILFVLSLDFFRTILLEQHRRPTNSLLSQAVLAIIVATSLFSFNTINVQNSRARLLLRETPIFVSGTHRYVRLAQVLANISRPQASIAVVAAGNTPYFYEANYIDLLGKNDTYIAHLPIITTHGYHDEFYEFQPGHVKWDLAYSIGVLMPDIVAQLPVSSAEAQQYLDEYQRVAIEDFTIFLRRGSENIRWEEVTE